MPCGDIMFLMSVSSKARTRFACKVADGTEVFHLHVSDE